MRKFSNWSFLTVSDQTNFGTFKNASNFQDGLARVELDNEYFYYTDKLGRVILHGRELTRIYHNHQYILCGNDGRDISSLLFRFSAAMAFSEGMAAVRRNNKWGFIDKSGKIVIDNIYEYCHSYCEGFAAVELSGKWGFIDKSGVMVVDAVYEAVKDFREGFAPVQLDGKWGFIDNSGVVVTKIIYDTVGHFSEGFAAICLNNKCGFTDYNGSIVIPLSYDGVGWFIDGHGTVKRGEKWGIIDRKGNFIIKPIFDKFESYSEGFYEVKMLYKYTSRYTEGSKYLIGIKFQKHYLLPITLWILRLINDYRLMYKFDYVFYFIINVLNNITGRLFINLLPIKRENVIASGFSEGLALVYSGISRELKCGYMDKYERVVIPFKFDYSRLFSEGLAAVKLNGKWGFIDKSGRMIVGADYDDVKDFQEGLAAVELNGKWGLINRLGEFIIEPCHFLIDDSNEGRMKVQFNQYDTNGNLGTDFTNSGGALLIDNSSQKLSDIFLHPELYECSHFSEDFSLIKLDQCRFTFIDRNGRVVLKDSNSKAHCFEDASVFSEGMAAVKLNGQWGFIDRNGKECIPLSFDNAFQFSEGFAAVQNRSRLWGFINRNGYLSIRCQYYSVKNFICGLAPVMKTDGWTFINVDGVELTKNTFEEVNCFSEGYAAIKSSGKWGFIDKSGNIKIPSIYDHVENFTLGLARVTLDGHRGCIHRSGVALIEL